jgi:hypothetical protein
MVSYWAQILQDSSTYIVETLCKVWSLNSSWFPGYSLLCTLATGGSPRYVDCTPWKIKILYLMTVVDYNPAILPQSTPNIDPPFHHIWGPKSPWLTKILPLSAFLVKKVSISPQKWKNWHWDNSGPWWTTKLILNTWFGDMYSLLCNTFEVKSPHLSPKSWHYPIFGSKPLKYQFSNFLWGSYTGYFFQLPIFLGKNTCF